jgi:hypothetical protein
MAVKRLTEVKKQTEHPPDSRFAPDEDNQVSMYASRSLKGVEALERHMRKTGKKDTRLRGH